MPDKHKAQIRIAQIDDSRDILDIYAPFVSETAITLTSKVPSLEQVAQTMLDIKRRYPYLVADIDGKVVGFAFANKMRPHDAFCWNAELSVYIAPGFQGQGIATAMYTALFQILKSQGFCNIYAVITLPNDASIALHKHFGFSGLSTHKASGYKMGKWQDIYWMGYTIPGASDPETHGPPLLMSEINKNVLDTALAMASTLLQVAE